MQESKKIYTMYEKLYAKYGPQGWWPFVCDVGYHPMDYSYPKNIDEVFEVSLGVILTQNTTFSSVERSLQNLKEKNALTPKAINEMDIDEFKMAIKPSGYFNQKADYILGFIEFFESLDERTPNRKELLSVKGIGEESADSILLYGYKQIEFVIDTYTKRMLVSLGLVDEKVKYKDMKKLMQDSIKEFIKDEKELLIVYQEYHALIVRHSKEFYSKKPYAAGCFL